MTDPGPRQVALEEVKILSEIIGRHDGYAAAIKAALVAALGALGAALYSTGTDEPLKMLSGAACIVTLFFLWALAHRVVSAKAIQRSAIVEKYLRGNGVYDGPKVGASLAPPTTVSELYKQMGNNLVTYAYVAIMTTVFLVLSIAPPKTRSEKQAQQLQSVAVAASANAAALAGVIASAAAIPAGVAAPRASSSNAQSVPIAQPPSPQPKDK